jgi:hypothetical protein
MKYTSLHTIITGYLLQRKYPIHFYVDFLIYAQRGMEELHFDTLGNVRTIKLAINETGAVTLPTDFLDLCKIGIVNGQFVKPLISRNGINRLNNFDTDGITKINYPETGIDLFNSFYPGLNYNDHLEFTGRMYGLKADRTDSYKILKERNEIQLHQSINATAVILEYISDGSEVDNATQINPYAKATIEAFINWKWKENNRSYSEYERTRAQRQFDHQHKILRARLNPLTLNDIKAIIYQNTSGAPI